MAGLEGRVATTCDENAVSELQALYWLLFAVSVLFSADLARQVISGRTKWPAQHGFFETVPAVPVLRSDRPVAYWFLIGLRAIAMAGLWLCWLSIHWR